MKLGARNANLFLIPQENAKRFLNKRFGMIGLDKRITIIGGTGFLGSYVVKLLAERGYQIGIIARDAETNFHIKTAGDVGQIKLISGDITKPESLQGKLAGSYAVINLAGILFEKGRQKFDAVQAEGAGKLAALAKQAGVERFVHVSAIGADSASPSRYARSKAAGEQAVKAAFPTSVILRPSIIFGVEDNFFNKFATMASLTPFLPLIGGGRNKFQPVYVLDVAHAALAAVERDSLQGKIFELGGPGVYTFRETLEFICLTIGRKPVFIPLPYALASLLGTFANLLPTPPLTADQVALLKSDNIVKAGANALKDIGIIPQSVENIVPLYLARFRRDLAQQVNLC
jgi:uncharacterized protein YbjT (DUF2867 family)